MATDYRGEGFNPTFGTKEQLEYARQMAKYLQSKDNRFHMTPGMAVLPASWVNAIGPNFIDQLASTDYAKIAGEGDLQIRNQAQRLPNSPSSPTTGDSLTNIFKKLTSGISNPFSSNKITPPGTESKEDITTGSIPPADKIEMDQPTSGPPTTVPGGINRSSFDSELKERPELIKRLASMVKGEVGLGPGTPVDKQIIQLETAFNRSQIRGHSLDQGLLTVAQDPKKGYYASDTYNRGGHYGERLTPQELEWFKKNVYEPVINGSDKGTEFLGSPVTGNASEGNENFASKRLARGLYSKGKWWDNNKGEMFVTEKHDADQLTANPNLLPRHTNPWEAKVTAEPHPMEGMMRLGGPTDAPPMPLSASRAVPASGPTPTPDAAVAPMGQQLAQAFGTQGPANNAPPSANPNSPLLTPKSPSLLDAQVRSVPLDEIGKVIEGHRQELKGEDVKGPFGTRRMIPDPTGKGNNKYIDMPNAIPGFAIDGVNTHLLPTPDGKGGYTMKILVPGAPGEGFDSLDSAKEWIRNQRALDTKEHVTAQEQADYYEKKRQVILDQADKSRLHLPQVNIIQKLVKDPSFYGGVGAEPGVLNYKKMLDFMGMDSSKLGQPAAMEVFQKLVASSNLAAMEQLRGYGQVRSTDLTWLQQSNANMSNRPEAIMALTDMAKRMHTRSVKINDLAMEYADNHKGKLDRGWDSYLRDWTLDNPLFTDKDIENYTKKLHEKVPTEQPNDTTPRKYIPGQGWSR